MSGNIQNTNIPLLKSEIDNLKNDIDRIIKDGETAEQWVDTLKRRYVTLSSTSNTLFMYIIKNYGSAKFNETFFNKTLDMMFNKIIDIQGLKTSQENASITVGEHLAKNFIPHIYDNK